MRAARKAGISYVSGDRKKDGLLPNMSIFENMVMSIYPAQSVASFLRFISRAKLDPIFEHETAQLSTKMGDSGNLIGSLSGGNQQKVVLAKGLQRNADVIIFDEPTRGIDVGAKYEIYRLIQQLADDGKAILMISSELPEILGMSDRILVMNEGRLTGEITEVPRTSQEDIMKLATQREPLAA